MAIPEGATRVHYNIFSQAGPAEVGIDFSVALPLDYPEDAHATAQAGAEAMVAHLRTAYPDRVVTANRHYDLRDAGDPWPAPEVP